MRPSETSLGHLGVFMVGEVEERGRGSELLTLKQHGNEGRGEHEAGGDLGASHADKVLKPFAGRAVADLVVILDEADEVVRGEAVDRPTVVAVAVARVLAVVDEDVRERFASFSKVPKSA